MVLVRVHVLASHLIFFALVLDLALSLTWALFFGKVSLFVMALLALFFVLSSFHLISYFGTHLFFLALVHGFVQCPYIFFRGHATL